MYVARFEADHGDWIQGIAALPVTPSPGRVPAWWDGLERALRAALLLPEVTASRRVLLDANGRLRQLVMLLAPSAREKDVRRTLGGLTRLEALVEGTVQLPQERDEHDAWAGDMPPWRWTPLAEEFSAGGIRLGVDLRVLPALSELLATARQEGESLAYQLILRSAPADPEASGEARRQVLALEAVAGVSGALIGSQEWAARKLANPHLLVQEIVAIDAAEHAESLSPLLRDCCRARSPELAGVRPAVRFVEDSLEEAVTLGIHGHDLHPLAGLELAGVSASEGERDGLVRWRPEKVDESAFVDATPALPVEAAADALPGLPPPFAGGAPYLFVSYKREDLARIAPLLRWLAATGVRFWYDRAIPGGAEWDAVIEERLEGAAMVLLFLSNAAIESKYVRREVKFADAIDRPIVCATLEEADLAHGMRMLLTQYQMLDVRAPDFSERMLGAIGHLRGPLGLEMTPL